MENLLDHDQGTIVEVVGQGVGRVIELNLELDNIKVDIGNRRPVSVPFGAVSKFLRPLPEGDFRRRKVEDSETLAAFVQESPGEALAEVIESLGNNIDVASIKAALEGVLDLKSWTSWWGKARKHPRVLTAGTGSRLRYSVSESAEDATGVLLDELEQADPRQRLTIATVSPGFFRCTSFEIASSSPANSGTNARASAANGASPGWQITTPQPSGFAGITPA